MPSRAFFCDSISYNAYIIDVVDSTNTYFKNNYQNYQDKSVLIANKQTNGRGRFERTWKSNNDICFSILYKKKELFSVIAPLAIIYALKDLNIDALIKWPNDIYVNNKKLSGILIEDIYKDSFLASIVGIGININDYDEFNAIGLASITNINRDSLIFNILKYIEYFKKLSNEKLIEIYKNNSLIINKSIVYKNQTYHAYDITKDGHLVLRDEDSTIIVNSNEISIGR